jgi:hypothetical protein
VHARRITLALAAAFALAACQDQPAAPAMKPAAGIPAADRAAIEALGFSAAGAVDAGDHYLVEGDVALSKHTLRGVPAAPARGVHYFGPLAAYMAQNGGPGGVAGRLGLSRSPAGGPRFQTIASTLASPSRVRNIKVNVSGISGRPTWVAAVRLAIQHWTDIAGCAVTMVESGPADISVVNFYDPNPVNGSITVAYSDYPKDATNGGPGPQVHINTAIYDVVYSDAQKEWVMSHELGHTLGFRHTNWSTNPNPEAVSPWGAGLVPNTPVTDTASVMNRGVLPGWHGFSANDQKAAIWMYGDTTQVTVANSGGWPSLTWNAISGASSYNVYISYEGMETYMDPDNRDNSYSIWSFGMEYVGSTTGSSLLDTINPYTGVTNCWRSDPDPNWTGGSMTSGYVVEAIFPNGSSYTHKVAPVCTSI